MYGDTMERSIGKQNIKRNNFLEGTLHNLRNLKKNKHLPYLSVPNINSLLGGLNAFDKSCA